MKNIHKHLVEEIKQLTDIAVIGLSGGIDSAVVSKLCYDALGPDNVYVVYMSDQIFGESFQRAKAFAEQCLPGAHFSFTCIQSVAEGIAGKVRQCLGIKYTNKVNRGNAASRARTNVLYGIAHELNNDNGGKRVRVIGTGNLSEDYIGYDTKGGDALADFFPIGGLFKSEVGLLAVLFRGIRTVSTTDFYNTWDAIIYAEPSAELWEGQTDEEELGYTYQEMEGAIKFIIGEPYGSVADRVVQFVKQRHAQNKHKHEASYVIKVRHLLPGGNSETRSS